MKLFVQSRWLLLLLLLALGIGAVGCSTTEPENASSRPWNAPRGWESGLPGGMMEGR